MRNILSRKMILLFAAASVAGGAFAEPPQDVTVKATRIEKTQVRGLSGSPVLEFSLKQSVSCEDLDLSTPAAVAELRTRVHKAAHAACEEIGRAYPFAKPSDEDCAQRATVETMVDVQNLLAGN